MSRLLITGGHLTPALGFIDYLRQQRPDVDIVFVGRDYAQAATAQLSWERQEIEARHLPFIDFPAPKTGSFNPFTYHRTITAASQLIHDHHVTHVLSFGGYLGLPFAIAGHNLHLPVITHEQTRVLGRANRAIGLFAQCVALSSADTQVPFYIRRTTVTGNPLREKLFAHADRPTWLTAGPNQPLLYIAGGSQGSLAINQATWAILPQLLDDYIVVHQVGRASRDHQPLAQAQAFMRSHELSVDRYFPREFLTVDELAYLYPHLFAAVSRAGANTVAELTAFHVPTLFIPLPDANYNEQERNASSLAEGNAALVLPQNELIPNVLLTKIRQLADKRNLLQEKLTSMPTDANAATRLGALFDFGEPAIDIAALQKIKL